LVLPLIAELNGGKSMPQGTTVPGYERPLSVPDVMSAQRCAVPVPALTTPDAPQETATVTLSAHAPLRLHVVPASLPLSAPPLLELDPPLLELLLDPPLELLLLELPPLELLLLDPPPLELLALEPPLLELLALEPPLLELPLALDPELLPELPELLELDPPSAPLDPLLLPPSLLPPSLPASPLELPPLLSSPALSSVASSPPLLLELVDPPELEENPEPEPEPDVP
jgi:hypothetical protein